MKRSKTNWIPQLEEYAGTDFLCLQKKRVIHDGFSLALNFFSVTLSTLIKWCSILFTLNIETVNNFLPYS